jgi:hypothetical protein
MRAQQTRESSSNCGMEKARMIGGRVKEKKLQQTHKDMVGCNSHESGWMDGWMFEDSNRNC